VSRGFAQSRAYPAYRGAYPGFRGGAFVGSHLVGGGVAFYRPYYSFSPRLSLGFGLWAGYPVAYPYYYGYPYAYPYPVDPYAYGYAAPSYGYPAPPYGYPAPPYTQNQSSAYPPSNYPAPGDPNYGTSGQGYQSEQPAPTIGVQRGGQQSAPGGVSFEITPDTAAVFVDGTYVGTAATFGPMSPPLGLIAGRHHIEVRAPGYRTMTFDSDVTAGQVVPYQGTMQRN
jgi:hypothetical protein